MRHLCFAPGGEKVWYREIPGIERHIEELQIPDEEELWGWGYFRRSSGDYHAHVAGGFAELTALLRDRGIAVDAVIACGPFQNSAERFVAALKTAVLPRVPMTQDDFRLVEDRECVTVMAALQEARQLVHGGHDEVLILAAEKVEEEASRFREYSFFSDFCLGMLVSARWESCPYEVLDVLLRADLEPGDDTSGILGRRLESACVAEILGANGLSIGQVDRFFYLNLFQPIAEMKGKNLGFAASQLDTGLAAELGHCSGADPFVNLQAFSERALAGRPSVLCASSRGSAGVALVRQLRDGAC